MHARSMADDNSTLIMTLIMSNLSRSDCPNRLVVILSATLYSVDTV
jgi:hypothetical protein